MTPKGVTLSTELKLPAEQLYWGVLEVPRTAARTRGMQLGYLFESVLPIEIEQVHAIYRRLADGRYLAVGVDRDVLQQHLLTHPQTVRIVPAALPAFLDVQIDANELNLLVEEFEARVVREKRRLLLWQCAAAIVLIAALLSVGLERRAATLRRHDAMIREASAALLDRVLSTSTAAANLPPEQRLLSELRLLRQTRQQPPAETATLDLTPELASLLKRWPANVHMQTESVTIAPGSLTVRGAVPQSADVQRLADALGQLEGWQLQQPQVSSARGAVSTTLQFKASKEKLR